MVKQKLLSMIDLLERMRNLKHLWLADPTPDPFLDMASFLMRPHLTGQLVTPSSLAHAADEPYTTATRRVAEVQAQGLLDLRSRTASARSFSVHPIPKLTSNLRSFLIASKTAIEACPKVDLKGETSNVATSWTRAARTVSPSRAGDLKKWAKKQQEYIWRGVDVVMAGP